MVKSATKSDDSPSSLACLAIAGLVPFVLYAFTAGGHSFWLDSAEFTAAAVDLDIAHPPGHPVASLWGRAFALLPVGPLPYRAAVAQGLAAAIAAGALQLAFARTLQVLGVGGRGRALISLGASWLLAFSYGFWFQAVRAEVYALQAMLICLALERLIKLATNRVLGDVRPLYMASFWLGLGLANHHFMSVLAVPALLHGLWRAVKMYGGRSFVWTLASGLVGLISYLYLPLRAASEPAMDLGHPVSWKSLYWVVSAQVYARRIGSQATQPLAERLADLLVILVEHFSFVALLLALAGLYLLARKRPLWPLACVWSVTALVTLCGRAWLNPVRGNPDVLGYMLPGFAAYLALGLAAVALLLSVLPARVRAGAELSFGVVTLLLSFVKLNASYAQASLASFHASDDFDQLRQQPLPARAVLVLTTPETTFRHWEAEAVERARPDVSMLPLPFVNYAGTGGVIVRRQPELRQVVQSYQGSADGTLSYAALAALAQRRPVLVEGDLTASWPLFPWLLPEGLFYRVLQTPPSRAQLSSAAATRAKLVSKLQASLATDLTAAETRRQLLWLHFMDALYFASQGEPALAIGFAQRGLALQPRERELLRLVRTLQNDPHSFRLRDFLPHN